MSEATTAAAILRNTYDGPAWYGPSVSQILEDVTNVQAQERPIAGCHTIWELVLHMNAWQEFSLDVIEDRRSGDSGGVVDWPEVRDTSPEAWHAAVAALKVSANRLRDAIAGLSGDRLREKVPQREFPIKVLAHGITDHTIYHAGQIVLLKKALAAG